MMRFLARCVAAMLPLFVAAQAAAAGASDPTFGPDPSPGAAGKVFTNISIENGQGPQDILLQPDGKTLLIGTGTDPAYPSGALTIARVDAAGALDTAFGFGGRAFQVFNGGLWRGRGLALASGNRVVAAAVSATDVGLTRFSAAGSADTTFGNGAGFVIPPASGAQRINVILQGLGVLPDDRIVVLVTVTHQFGAPITRLLRLNADGTFDTTLGGSGSITLPFNAANGHPGGLVLYADGRMLVVGAASPQGMAVARFLANGAPDPAFNGGATDVLDLGPGSYAAAAALYPDGRILVGGAASSSGSSVQAALVRLTASGAPDASFNGTGTVVMPLTGASVVKRVAIDSAGRALATGVTSYVGPGPVPSAPFLVRRNAVGSADAAFDGQLRPFGAGEGTSLAVLPDDRILVGDDFGPELAVRLFLATGAPDTSFGANATARVRITRGSVDAGNALALQPDGKIVVAGNTSIGSSPSSRPLALVRYLPNGQVDSAFGKRTAPLQDALCSLPCTTSANAVLVQPDGHIVTGGGHATQGFNTGSVPKSSFTFFRWASDGGSFTRWTLDFEDFSVVRGMAQQADGRIVAVGETQTFSTFGVTASPSQFALARFAADGTPDTSFNGAGAIKYRPAPGEASANAVAVQADGRIVVAGYATAGSANRQVAAVRFTANGSFDGSFLDDISGANDIANAIAIQADGKIVLAGETQGGSFFLRFTFEGGLDATFGTNGRVIVSGVAIRGVAIQADGKIVGVNRGWETFRLLANGTPDPSYGVGGRFTQDLFGDAAAIVIQPDGKYVAAGTGGSEFQGSNSDFALLRIDPLAPSSATLAPAPLDFGAQSMNTASPPLTATLTNQTNAAISVTLLNETDFGTQPPSHFPLVGNTCPQMLAAGASCTFTFVFRPLSAGPLQVARRVQTSVGMLVLQLWGTGERSLTTHYYRSILGRAPDAGGKQFWESEATRMQNLGANVNEVWFAMASAFYGSAEYAARGRDDAGFVTDLYNTFFNRSPDAGGLSFWTGQLASGLPRELALAGFELSSEFAAFTQAIFGNTAARAEVDMVMDFYRGVLGRLPDSNGFAGWVGQFRNAQCQGAGAVYGQADAISRSFVLGQESTQRNRSNGQFVGDMYNAFLRRGGDLGGVQFWISQLDGGMSRDQMRARFIGTPEFNGRVNAVVNQGCVQ